MRFFVFRKFFRGRKKKKKKLDLSTSRGGTIKKNNLHLSGFDSSSTMSNPTTCLKKRCSCG